MKHLYKTTPYLLLLVFLLVFSIQVKGQNIVSYAYDNAGNRISRKVVDLGSNPTHAKKTVDDTPAPPVEDQLGERKITIYPNPTKGALAVGITGGSDKDDIRIMVMSSQGIQLQTMKTAIGTTRIDMKAYPSGWYILKVQAGDKATEFKIIKQ